MFLIKICHIIAVVAAETLLASTCSATEKVNAHPAVGTNPVRLMHKAVLLLQLHCRGRLMFPPVLLRTYSSGNCCFRREVSCRQGGSCGWGW